MTDEDLERFRKSNECRVCGCVPINNQGRCAEHAEPGDTIGAPLIVPPATYKIFKELSALINC